MAHFSVASTAGDKYALGLGERHGLPGIVDLLALILMLVLVFTPVSTLRRRLWTDYHLFRHLHAVVAVAIVALTGFHVLGSGFNLNNQWKIGVVLGLGLAALVLFAAEKFRSQLAPGQPMLPVAFEHLDHKDTPCAECHHNFVDDTGGGTCYACHKYTPEIAAEMEKMFHDYCFGCHVSRRSEGEESGPMRECQGCHHR